MKIKRWVGIAILSVVVSAALPAAAQQEPLRIGAMIALSGPASVFGVPAEKALRLLLDDLGAGGIGGRPFQLIVYDTEGNSTKAVQLFHRLVENDRVDIVLGPSTSGESLAVGPLANQLEVPEITFGGAEAITKPNTPYVFATSPTDRLVVENLMTEFRDKKITRLALIYSNDAFGQSGGNVAKGLAAQYGVSVVADETFAPQDVDMSPQLLRIRAAEPQAMLIWSANPGPSIVLRNAAELGLAITAYASYASGSRQFISQTGPAAEGCFVPSYRIISPDTLPDDDALKAPLVTFAKRYKERWGVEPDQTSGHSYDVILWLDQALRNLKGRLTRKSLRDGLESAKFDGANGPRRGLSADDHRGLDKTSVVMMQARAGQWHAVQKQ